MLLKVSLLKLTFRNKCEAFGAGDETVVIATCYILGENSIYSQLPVLMRSINQLFSVCGHTIFPVFGCQQWFDTLISDWWQSFGDKGTVR